jgi:hypothetical protein
MDHAQFLLNPVPYYMREEDCDQKVCSCLGVTKITLATCNTYLLPMASH